MKKFALLVLSFSLLAGASPALARPRGWGPAGPYARMYDPSKVETLSGEVAKVNQITPMRGMSTGIELLLKTEQGVVPVHLGPAWFIDNQETKIAPGDKVEVKGSRVTIGGKPTILAATVKKGDGVLLLRDDTGYPAWAGWRRQPPK